MNQPALISPRSSLVRFIICGSLDQDDEPYYFVMKEYFSEDSINDDEIFETPLATIRSSFDFDDVGAAWALIIAECQGSNFIETFDYSVSFIFTDGADTSTPMSDEVDMNATSLNHVRESFEKMVTDFKRVRDKKKSEEKTKSFLNVIK